MDLFDSIFGDKQHKVLIPLRIQAGENFKKILLVLGISSFRFQVGDEDGENTERLFLISNIRNNPDVQGFVDESLTKPHTAQNLMSIGFKQIVILIENRRIIENIYELKDYAK